MDKELSGIEGVKSRMDDILIMGKDHAQHDERLRKVIDRPVEREEFIFPKHAAILRPDPRQSGGEERSLKGQSHCGHDRTQGYWRPETILRISQSSYEILPQFGGENEAPTRLAQEGKGLGMGPSPTRSLQTPEDRNGFGECTRTVWPRKGNNCFLRCKQFWT